MQDPAPSDVQQRCYECFMRCVRVMADRVKPVLARRRADPGGGLKRFDRGPPDLAIDAPVCCILICMSRCITDATGAVGLRSQHGSCRSTSRAKRD